MIGLTEEEKIRQAGSKVRQALRKVECLRTMTEGTIKHCCVAIKQRLKVRKKKS